MQIFYIEKVFCIYRLEKDFFLYLHPPTHTLWKEPIVRLIMDEQINSPSKKMKEEKADEGEKFQINQGSISILIFKLRKYDVGGFF